MVGVPYFKLVSRLIQLPIVLLLPGRLMFAVIMENAFVENATVVIFIWDNIASVELIYARLLEARSVVFASITKLRRLCIANPIVHNLKLDFVKIRHRLNVDFD